MTEGPLGKAKAKRKAADPARKLAVESARLAEGSRCSDIVVLDLRERSPVTDYFVIATGTSDRQRRSAADDLVELAEQFGSRPLNVAGLDQPNWILVDFVDVVVHLFDASARRFYDLEMLWGDAPRVRWQRRKTGGDDTTTRERGARDKSRG